MKTDEVFTDDENNNVDGPIILQEVASNVKTDEVFTARRREEEYLNRVHRM